MAAVKWSGSEQVIQYRSCHHVNLIDDYHFKKYQQPNKLEYYLLKILPFFQ